MSSGKELAKKEIEIFFGGKHTRDEVKKMKRKAMAHNLRLGENRKKFCKSCLSMNLRTIGIKSKLKKVECLDCKKRFRWKIK